MNNKTEKEFNSIKKLQYTVKLNFKDLKIWMKKVLKLKHERRRII